MPSKRCHVLLSEAERVYLLELISTGTSSAQKLTRARILLKADQADWTDRQSESAHRRAGPQSLCRTRHGKGAQSKAPYAPGQPKV